MVNLSFIIRVCAPIEPLWEYFSNFETISQWDPNVRKSSLVKSIPQKIGQSYDLVTVFNGNESNVTYKITQYDKLNKICLIGQNKMITAIDQIHFRSKGDQTEIEYRADISLNGIYWLATPFIRSGLDKLTAEARVGMMKKCQEKFGKAY